MTEIFNENDKMYEQLEFYTWRLNGRSRNVPEVEPEQEVADGRGRKHQSLKNEVDDADASLVGDVVVDGVVLDHFREAFDDHVADQVRLREVGQEQRVGRGGRRHSAEDADGGEAVFWQPPVVIVIKLFSPSTTYLINTFVHAWQTFLAKTNINE
jgi:hypothetical protein